MSKRDVLSNYELELPVQLEEQDRLESGKKLAEVIHQRQTMLEDSADRRREVNEAVKLLDAEIDALADRVRTGYEMRSVPVQEIADYDSGQIEIFRQDSGERVSARDMGDDEKQRALPV